MMIDIGNRESDGPPHDFHVLHFGAQCPWYLWAIEQARLAAGQLRARLVVTDVMEEPESAAEYRMFFPFMTVIDHDIRTPSPLSAESLIDWAEGAYPTGPARPVHFGRRTFQGSIHPLTSENVDRTVPLCIEGVSPIAGREKRNWWRSVVVKSGCPSLGFMAVREGRVRAAVEYLPMRLVPYPLPRKDPEVAFITCVYPTQPEIDHRAPLLNRLTRYLGAQGFKEVQVVAGRCTPFPNGPLGYFERLGFSEVEEVDRILLAEGEETLVLMRKVVSDGTQWLHDGPSG